MVSTTKSFTEKVESRILDSAALHSTESKGDFLFKAWGKLGATPDSKSAEARSMGPTPGLLFTVCENFGKLLKLHL